MPISYYVAKLLNSVWPQRKGVHTDALTSSMGLTSWPAIFHPINSLAARPLGTYGSRPFSSNRLRPSTPAAHRAPPNGPWKTALRETPPRPFTPELERSIPRRRCRRQSGCVFAPLSPHCPLLYGTAADPLAGRCLPRVRAERAFKVVAAFHDLIPPGPSRPAPHPFERTDHVAKAAAASQRRKCQRALRWLLRARFH